MTSRNKALRNFASKVSAAYGAGTVGFGCKGTDILRIPSGSIPLDAALGGGLPVGRVTMLYGEKSSGKTTTAYRMAGISQGLCANCLRPAQGLEVEETFDEETGEIEFTQTGTCDCHQLGMISPRQYPEEKKDEFKARLKRYEENSYEPYCVALIDMEGAFDRDWAHKLGLDERLVVYVRPDTAEEAIDIYDSLLRTGSVDMVILDSIAALTPSKEVEESMEKWQQGLQARLVNKFVRKVQATANAVARDFGRQVTQVWINQVREKIGVMFGDPTTTPGGKGQGFATSVELKMWSSQYETENVAEMPGKEKDIQIATSVRVNFRCDKNKTAPPKGTGSYVMRLADGSIDEGAFVLSMCEKYGHINRDGSTWMLGDETFKTRKAMVERLNEPEMFAQARKLVTEKLLGG